MDAKQIKHLCQEAIAASEQAYAPYSKYKVGAALWCADGSVIRGCNVENSSYPVGLCAEINVFSTAIAQNKRLFKAIAVATHDMGTPCGQCRQFMTEFKTDLEVIVCNFEGQHKLYFLSELLPKAFAV